MNSRLAGPPPGRTLLVLGIVVLATILVPASGFGQFLSTILSSGTAGPPPSGIPMFGTGSESVLVIGADAFELTLGTENLPDGLNSGRSCSVGLGPDDVCVFIATVNLSSGALITGIDLEACDVDPVAQFAFALAQFSVPVQNGTYVSPLFASGATPGCAVFPVALSRTVNNTAEKLVMAVNLQPSINVGFTTARVHYKLQVSPAPATATFGDVPTSHPFFQFIEALAASGITGGCGSGNYCPNNPVTRGQMAVFLAKALGLQFPN
jgi:hypothetical protein